MLAMWMEDGQTLEEQRAALAQLVVERIEFDPVTGEGRMHYRNRRERHAVPRRYGGGEPRFGQTGV